MQDGWQWALGVQQGVVVLASGFNTFHLLSYRTGLRKRRWGVLALVLVNLAFMVQGLYLGLLPPLTGEGLSELLREPRAPFMVGLFPLAASLLMLAFVVSARRGMRRGRLGRG